MEKIKNDYIYASLTLTNTVYRFCKITKKIHRSTLRNIYDLEHGKNYWRKPKLEILSASERDLIENADDLFKVVHLRLLIKQEYSSELFDRIPVNEIRMKGGLVMDFKYSTLEELKEGILKQYEK